jgi:hypothetical protein
MGVEGSLAAEHRRKVILDLLRAGGRVDIAQAAERLDVHRTAGPGHPVPSAASPRSWCRSSAATSRSA